jgi:hypothetical protein
VPADEGWTEMRVKRIEKRLDLVEAWPLLMRHPPERLRNFRRKARP